MNFRKQLVASLSSAVAVNWVKRQNEALKNWRAGIRINPVMQDMDLYALCKYASILEWTNDVVLTKVQTSVLQSFAEGVCVYASLRRKDTGATALFCRYEGMFLTVFEDGSIAKGASLQLDGAWSCTARIKRNVKRVSHAKGLVFARGQA